MKDLRRSRLASAWRAVALLMLLSAPLQAQTGSIAGRVVDARDDEPLAAAQVFIGGLDLGSLTQQNGSYVLANVPPGTHTVAVQRIGYRETTQTVVVAAGQTAVLNFRITEEALQLDEIVITGTAGGSARRAVGNAVDRLEVAAVARQVAIPTVTTMLTGRVPGLQFQRATGTVGGGSRIQIRGAGSFTLSSNPLIYVDGVRVNNDSRAGPPIAYSGGFRADDLGRGETNLLNDLNMEEIESIEVIKGPAAATLYGTEASAGVIQIITKRGQEGAPQFDFSMSQGANFLMDPAGKMGTNYICTSSPVPPCPEADRLAYNMYDESNRYISGEVLNYDGTKVFDWPTRELYQNGHVQSYDLSVRGGTPAIRYYLAANYADEAGVEWYNTDEKYRVRANMNVLLTEDLTLDVSSSYIDGRTRYADPVAGEGGAWRNAKDPIWQCLPAYQSIGPYMRQCPRTSGYYEQTPGDAAQVETTRTYNRFIGGATLNHTYGEWFTQRAVVGIDKGWDLNERYFPVDDQPVYRETTDGTIDWERPSSTNLSFEYSASVNLQVREGLRLETSLGAQYFVRRFERFQVIGQDFASELSRTINQTPVEKMVVNYEDIENKSVGMFAQEQVSWNDRLFLTGAVRLDDNSAFGGNFDAQIYPKLSAAWVVSDEGFWNFEVINSLRLRGAWGKAGRQPNTFAGTNLYGVIPAAGGSGIIPVQPGNQDVGPEVSSELEVGFDIAVLEDRFSGAFTYFWQTVDDALLSERLPTSIGFPGSIQKNIGRIDKWGWEASANARVYESDAFAFDLALTGSLANNEIKRLGDVAPSTAIRVGYPYPNQTTNYLVADAQLDATGQVIRASVLCDTGVLTGPDDAPTAVRGRRPGGPIEQCQTSGRRDILVGPAFHPYTVAVNPTISLLQNSIQIFALAEGKYGGISEDSNAPWQGQYSGVKKFWDNDDPVYLAGRLNSGPFRDLTVDEQYRGDFWKLREIGVRYQLPESLVARTGADRASISFSGRGLWTIWQRHETVGGVAIADPENGSTLENNGNNYYVTPPSSSINVTMRVSF